MSKTWTEERFQEALKKSVYTLVEGEVLKTGNHKVKLVCENGHDNYKSPLQIERGTGCAVCKGVAALTMEDVKRKLEPTKFRLAEGFVYQPRKNVEVVCDKGHTMSMQLYDIERGGGCYMCSVCPPWTLSRVLSYSVPLGLTMVEDNPRIMSKVPIQFQCSAGHYINITPRALATGVGCSRCNKTTGRVHLEDMKDRLRDVGLKLVDDSEYVNVTTKITVQCANGHISKVLPHNTYTGHGCGLCKISAGEKAVEEALQSLGVQYVREKTFPTCKNKLVLPFDFYVEDLNLLIEYDGMQHYEPVEFFGGIPNLRYVQYLDSIKTKWAEDNGVILLRIPYTELKSVNDIVTKQVNSLKK